MPPQSEDTVSRWITGTEIRRPEIPLICTLLPEYGVEFADYFDTTVPVMSRRLIDHLIELGVNNFDQYPVIFKRPDTSEQFSGYSAVNFKGTYDAVDLTQSKYRMRFDRPYCNGPIVLDPLKVGDLPIFRLAMGPSFLVVGDRIAKAIKVRKYKAVLVQPVHEYSGN